MIERVIKEQDMFQNSKSIQINQIQDAKPKDREKEKSGKPNNSSLSTDSSIDTFPTHFYSGFWFYQKENKTSGHQNHHKFHKTNKEKNK